MLSPQKQSGDNGVTGSSPRAPAALPAPSSPYLSNEVPIASFVNGSGTPGRSSFDKKCTQLLRPVDTRRKDAHLTHDELHNLCRRRCYAQTNFKEVLRTRLPTTDAVGRERNNDAADAKETSEDLPVTKQKRRRADDLHSVFVVDAAIVKEPAQKWGPEMKARWNVNHGSPVEGVGPTNSAWTADKWGDASAGTPGRRGNVAWEIGPCCHGTQNSCVEEVQGY